MAILGGRGDWDKMVGERTDQEVEMGTFLAKSERHALKGVFGTHTYASEGEPLL